MEKKYWTQFKKKHCSFWQIFILRHEKPKPKELCIWFKKIVLCVMQLSEVKGKEATESASITEQILLTRTEFFENWSL